MFQGLSLLDSTPSPLRACPPRPLPKPDSGFRVDIRALYLNQASTLCHTLSLARSHHTPSWRDLKPGTSTSPMKHLLGKRDAVGGMLTLHTPPPQVTVGWEINKGPSGGATGMHVTHAKKNLQVTGRTRQLCLWLLLPGEVPPGMVTPGHRCSQASLPSGTSFLSTCQSKGGLPL